jgi:hypothetical protein
MQFIAPMSRSPPVVFVAGPFATERRSVLLRADFMQVSLEERLWYVSYFDTGAVRRPECP